MGSNAKKRTTMAKLNREGKLRDKRAQKEARKAARKLSAERYGDNPRPGPDEVTDGLGDFAETEQAL